MFSHNWPHLRSFCFYISRDPSPKVRKLAQQNSLLLLHYPTTLRVHNLAIAHYNFSRILLFLPLLIALFYFCSAVQEFPRAPSISQAVSKTSATTLEPLFTINSAISVFPSNFCSHASTSNSVLFQCFWQQ